MAIIGAILGDISGSQYEKNRPKNLDYKQCELFTKQCCFTDDTVMTLAAKEAVISKIPFADAYRKFGTKYPLAGYGTSFIQWMYKIKKEPYNSFGNGSVMRCSYIGERFCTEKEVAEWAEKSAECTHNHPEGIKGASKKEILAYTAKNYPKSDYQYGVEHGLDEYRNTYKWSVTCQDSVPVAIRCFLESEDYESFLRNVYSLYCDMDTLCAIGGGIAEEFYNGTGLDNDMLLKKYLDEYLYEILKK